MKTSDLFSARRILLRVALRGLWVVIGMILWLPAAARAQSNAPTNPLTSEFVASQPGPVPPHIPGTATITVNARASDGSIPVGSVCSIRPKGGTTSLLFSSWTPPADWPTNPPIVVGTNGDWVIYNVTPFSGHWTVTASDPSDPNPILVRNDEALLPPNVRWVRPAKDERVSVSLMLLFGTTVTGRLVDADTGKPIAGATYRFPDIVKFATLPDDLTDAEGRFTATHVHTNGGLLFGVTGADYVSEAVKPTNLAENTKVNLPDVTLRHGGWISGRVIYPAGRSATPAVSTTVAAAEVGTEIEPDIGNKFSSWWPQADMDRTNGTFRVGPLPPGSYKLSANAFGDGNSNNPWQAEGQTTGIQVTVGKETKDVVLEMKMAH